ncbi:MAG TPA: anaerobic sulfatase maturase [Clostridiales bacterium]|nr:anaerobic sulfatase maturase [Clostridiales bacterium]
MPPLSLLIKPASSSCNLRCKYCFYHSIAENRSIASYGMMNIETAELLIRKSFDYAENMCTFAFQGGEPTLAGLEFYKSFVELVNKYNTKKIGVHFAIQTNGTLIDEQWADFLFKNNFLVGLSLDGPKEINDVNRVNHTLDGTFSKIMNTVNIFNKYGVQYNILSVVNNSVARHTNKVYNFFKKYNFKYLQFIQCLDPLDEKPGGHSYSLTPLMYSNFLKGLFDLWYNDITKGEIVSIRYFDNLVGMMMGHPPETCGMMGRCQCYFVIEADGGVYPCDFYVTDQWKLGNIKENDFHELLNTDTGKRFIEVSMHVDDKCKECKWFNFCRGGCRRTREPFSDGLPVLNYYCESYYNFFEYAGERLYKLSRMFSRQV